MTSTCASATRRWKVSATAVAVGVLATLAPGGTAPPAGAATPPAPDDAWVVAVYRDVLDRAPTAAQRRLRVAQLQAGRSRRSVADELVASREHARLLVARQYDRVLGRPADPASATYWTDRLVAGERPTTVASFIYGSAELFGRAGGTAAGYVALLYRDVLGREPDAAGAAYWAGRVEAGENRTGLARSWLLTPEATGLRAGVVFLDLLKRPPSAPERTGWAENLRRLDERRVTAAIVASAEAYELAQRPTAPTRLTGGDGASTTPSISADGRIVAFASTAGDLTPAGSPPGADIFVLDRRTGRLRAITAGNGTSAAPEVSADGSTVVFQSAATNLVGGDANGRVDVFRAPTGGGPVERLTDGDGDSTAPHTDADGTVVSFTSAATDLVAEDPNGATLDVYVRTDGDPATLERIGGDEPTSGGALTADGDAVVYSADFATYLARLPLGPDPEVVEVTGEGFGSGPDVSADGRRVAYHDLSAMQPPFQQLTVATLDDDGDVVTRETVAGGRLGAMRISADGRVVLVTTLVIGGEHAGIVDQVFAVGGGAPPSYPALPEGSDLTADGRIVVGSRNGQLRLHEAA